MFCKTFIVLLLTASVSAANAANLDAFKLGPSYTPHTPDKEDMQNFGKALSNNGVREVIFVHGTFVGTDGSGFVNILSNGIGMDIGESIKSLKDKMTGDVGNYSETYVNDFCRLIGNSICQDSKSSRFVWSSGNYHKARLMGSIQLAATLANQIRVKHITNKERILLIGHSHAGQVFALLTHLLAGGKQADTIQGFIDKHKQALFDECRKDKEAIENLKENLKTIATIHLDFVTFGTPVRYAWGNYSKFRLMTVINHRHPTNPADIVGLYKVQDGDYVQQWGVEGTDTLLNPKEISEEKELSEILGDAGVDLLAFKASLEDHSRRPPKNMPSAVNYLVDYGDDSKTLLTPPTYFLQKLFGHGIYTKKEAMQYNTMLIVGTLYLSNSSNSQPAHP